MPDGVLGQGRSLSGQDTRPVPLRPIVPAGPGVEGVVFDDGGPWGVAFDERVPGDAGSAVVVAGWVKRMKRGLSEKELWLVVGELDRCWREGREFDRKVCEFRYWRRVRSGKG